MTSPDPSSQPAGPPARQPDPSEARFILEQLSELVEPLHRTIPGGNEVVLHDLTALPKSVVAISGNVTGQAAAAPPESALRALTEGAIRSEVAFGARQPGGREVRSSTIVMRDSAGAPVAALCVNVDVTMWRAVHEVASSMLPDDLSGREGNRREHPEEIANDIDELAQHLLSQAIAAAGAPLELMQKRHKLAVVQDLKERGYFMLKESVETAAAALGVTRFTIYNYLNQLERDDESA